MTAARDYARSIVEATSLADKLVPPPDDLVVDDTHGPLLLAAPGRPPALAITPGRHARVPPIAGMRDPAQRARILHALANHELQAIELFAWALLAFPSAPRAFRTGLVAILADEQRHLALYADRLAAHGVAFGDQPVTGHFWHKLDQLATPLGFVCAMGLTFENANLDFAGEYATAARAVGDNATADVLAQVHADEIGHVRFGWIWLGKLAGESATGATDEWTAYTSALAYPLGPHRARGLSFDADARRRAGLSEDFIAKLAAVEPRRPGGAPR
jgi:uncharacterized ferritin-like protein (DUF455 family)